MSHADELDPVAFRFEPGSAATGDRLDRFDTADTGPFDDEEDAREATERGARDLARHVLMLEAHGTHGVIVIVQGMDAAGKDEAIHHVLAAVDPDSAHAKSFARPSDPEALHPYLRRASLAVPARGELAIFNRSYYEQVVADRVHPENLERQRLPPAILRLADDGRLWPQRFRQIRDFERYLRENGVEVVKLFLHVSKEEQRSRLLERIRRPEKRWDFDLRDVEERERWPEYMAAYQEAFRATSVPESPWYVIPSDHRWFARAAAAEVILHRLRRIHDDFPEPDEEQQEALREGRRRLERE